MQQRSSLEAIGFNRRTAAPVGAFATAVALLLAGLPAAAEAGPIAPQAVNPQVVTPTPVTPHVLVPSASPTAPASPTSDAEEPASPTPVPATATVPATDAPEAAQNPAESAPPASRTKTPAEKQKELLEQLRASLGFTPAPSAPERTSGWSVFDRVLAIVREYFCPRFTWQGAMANVENAYEPSCF